MTEMQDAMGTAGGSATRMDSSIESLVPADLQDAFLKREARVRRFIQSHPVPVVLGALAAGFILARLARLVREH